MGEILVRDLDPKTVTRLKARARRNGRSLQSEAKLILESAAGYAVAKALAVAERVRKTFGRRRFSDSSKLIREDRKR